MRDARGDAAGRDLQPPHSLLELGQPLAEDNHPSYQVAVAA